MERTDLSPFKAGQTLVLVATWTNEDDGEAVLLDGAWAACTFRNTYCSDPIVTVTSDDGDIVFGEDGVITITVSEDNTNLLNTTCRIVKGIFDLKVVLDDGTVDFPIPDGRWVCYPSSTVAEPVV